MPVLQTGWSYGSAEVSGRKIAFAQLAANSMWPNRTQWHHFLLYIHLEYNTPV